jgi:hypothetical protein
VPPSGWQPTKASDDDLAKVGFPSRPRDPEALRGWTARFGNYKGAETANPTMCETDRLNGGTDVYNGNWSGLDEAPPGGRQWRSASGSIKQTAFVFDCTHKSAHSSWVGVGGANTSSLLQAGTDVDFSSGAPMIFGWWELINSAHSNPAVKFASNIVPAHTIYMDAEANPLNGTVASVFFFLYDETTSMTLASASMSSYMGSSAASYYDGTSADWIEERPANPSLAFPVDGKYYYYSKPALGNQVWSGMHAVDDSVAQYSAISFPYNRDILQRPNGAILGSINNSETNVGASTNMTDTWRACS